MTEKCYRCGSENVVEGERESDVDNAGTKELTVDVVEQYKTCEDCGLEWCSGPEWEEILKGYEKRNEQAGQGEDEQE